MACAVILRTKELRMPPVIVVGHKNPDNDAISAAYAYAYLKNELERRTRIMRLITQPIYVQIQLNQPISHVA